MTVPFTHLALHSFQMFIIEYMGRSQKLLGNKTLMVMPLSLNEQNACIFRNGVAGGIGL